MATPPRRRWFQFRLQSLLIVVAIVAVPFAWVAKERRQSRYEEQVADQLRRQGFKHAKLIGRCGSWDTFVEGKPQSGWRALARQILGSRVSLVWNMQKDFNDLTPLAGLKNVRMAFFAGTQVADLTPLSGLNTLRSLNLSGTLIDDLTPLAGLSNLEDLAFEATNISDLKPLFGLTKLQLLQIRSTPVTKEQVDALQSALPNCKIAHDPFR